MAVEPMVVSNTDRVRLADVLEYVATTDCVEEAGRVNSLVPTPGCDCVVCSARHLLLQLYPEELKVATAAELVRRHLDETMGVMNEHLANALRFILDQVAGEVECSCDS